MKVGLALSGGGARTIAHIEFLKVIDELNLEVSEISATSGGAIIGALYASGLSGTAIEEIFKNLSPRKIFSLIGIDFNPKGLFKREKPKKYLSDFFKEKKIENLEIPLKIVATDLFNQEEVIIEKGNLLNALSATSAIPALFPPVKIKGRVLVDGGLMNPLPYDCLKSRNIIALDVTKKEKQKKNQIPSLGKTAVLSFELFQRSVLKKQLQLKPPGFYYNFSLRDVDLLDFHKINFVLQEAKKEAKKFKQVLMKSPAFRDKIK